MEDYKLLKVNRLLDLSKEAAQRSRQSVLITSLGALIVFSACFNSYFSWMRHVVPDERISFAHEHAFCIEPDSILKATVCAHLKDTTDPPLKDTSYHLDAKCLDGGCWATGQLDTGKFIDHVVNMNWDLKQWAYRKMIDGYMERQFFTVPILGIRYSSHDLSILGSIGLLILLTWQFYATRRETHLVEQIKKEFDWMAGTSLYGEQKTFILDYMLQGSVQNFVFITATNRDRRWIERSASFTLITLFPIFTLLFVGIGEWVSIHWKKHFVLENLFDPKYQTGDFLFVHYTVEQYIRAAIWIISLIVITILVLRVRHLSNQTRKYFRDMQAVLKPEEEIRAAGNDNAAQPEV